MCVCVCVLINYFIYICIQKLSFSNPARPVEKKNIKKFPFFSFFFFFAAVVIAVVRLWMSNFIL